VRATVIVGIWAICWSCGACGCGTFENLRGEDPYVPTERVYGGVRYDFEKSMIMLADTSGGHGGWLGRSAQLLLGPYLLLVDLPISAVGDTLTLPILLERNASW